MSHIDETPEDEEKQGPRLVWTNPELSTGGPGGGDHNWLFNIPRNTVFLAKKRTDKTGWAYTEFTHGGYKEGVPLLIENIGNGKAHFHWVDPVIFSAMWQHIINLHTYPEDNDGSSN